MVLMRYLGLLGEFRCVAVDYLAFTAGEISSDGWPGGGSEASGVGE